MENKKFPIGVFDSGYGGLTILSAIRKLLPEYDYVYLGDNARSPYGTRSFDVINDFTLQAVRYLFSEGCPLVILACNTASAKALREIQQKYLPTSEDPSRRGLGVIRPLVEYGESNGEGADFFVQKYLNELLEQDKQIDSIVLACTHYPLLRPKIEQYLPEGITLLSQGELVATSLKDYLNRHPEMNDRLTQGGSIRYLTTECPDKFGDLASIFVDEEVNATRVKIN